MKQATRDTEPPLWQRIYDHATPLTPGDIITYLQLTDILGYDPSQPGKSRSPIHTASRRMLIDLDRTLVAVPKIGYRVAYAHEHETIARTGQRAARRKVSRALDVITHVDITALATEQRRSADALVQVLSMQAAMLARHDARIGTVEKDVRRVDDRVAALEQIIASHGIQVPDEIVVDDQS